jgi:hypothetical protein
VTEFVEVIDVGFEVLVDPPIFYLFNMKKTKATPRTTIKIVEVGVPVFPKYSVGPVLPPIFTPVVIGAELCALEAKLGVNVPELSKLEGIGEPPILLPPFQKQNQK